MALSERMKILQDAMSAYSDMTVKSFRTIEALGDAIVQRLPIYLGEGSEARGVPPEGEYREEAGDYRGAKFSTHDKGTLTLAPIQMGVAVGIPRTSGKGKFWPRVVLEFEMIGDAITVRIGDSPRAVRGIPPDFSEEDVERVCEEIHEYIRVVLENPVKVATAVGKGKLGFI
ncbi:hypothetical protein [Bradyrhizobium sp. RT9a]